MNKAIKRFLGAKHLNPKLEQWLWFAGLWLLGLTCVLVITIPIKLLIKACSV